MSFSIKTRTEWIAGIETTPFDVAIIGGGITGASIALRASQAGHKVLLVEKNDFGSGTSSQSSKLVHGGLRYLQQYHFGLVATALKERYDLLQRAPHLVKKLSFLLPIFKDSPNGYWMLHAGLFFYDFLCFFHQIGWHKMLNKKALKQRLPQLATEGLKAAANYFDAQGDDSRLVLAILLTAAQESAHILNYVEVQEFVKSSQQITGLQVMDRLTNKSYQVKAKVVINATGAWSDSVRWKSNPEVKEPHLRNTKGIHIVVRREKCPLDDAVMLFSKIDKRAMFAIPWEGFTLLGTTDDDYDQSLDDVNATSTEVNYILKSMNMAFSGINLTRDDILSTLAGLRPLVLKTGLFNTSEVSREHDIFESPNNLFNIIGGKLTTCFKMAQDTLNHVYQHHPELKKNGLSITNKCLVGSQAGYQEAQKKIRHDQLTVDREVAESLLNRYGSKTLEILELVDQDPALGKRLVEKLPYIWAELDYTVKNEGVVRLDDFMLRRTRLFYLAPRHGQDVVKAVAERLARLLKWTSSDLQQQLAHYADLCEKNDAYKKS